VGAIQAKCVTGAASSGMIGYPSESWKTRWKLQEFVLGMGMIFQRACVFLYSLTTRSEQKCPTLRFNVSFKLMHRLPSTAISLAPIGGNEIANLLGFLPLLLLRPRIRTVVLLTRYPGMEDS
jgi:hypothetical protein